MTSLRRHSISSTVRSSRTTVSCGRCVEASLRMALLSMQPRTRRLCSKEPRRRVSSVLSAKLGISRSWRSGSLLAKSLLSSSSRLRSSGSAAPARRLLPFSLLRDIARWLLLRRRRASLESSSSPESEPPESKSLSSASSGRATPSSSSSSSSSSSLPPLTPARLSLDSWRWGARGPRTAVSLRADRLMAWVRLLSRLVLTRLMSSSTSSSETASKPNRERRQRLL
mmetsp:Transcript_25378/g.80722  ORF Transcript_25378/g.80722 Transcript_25378/m.80722 type:complete len:226 (+) Transcript_25378:1291-1968(+)